MKKRGILPEVAEDIRIRKGIGRGAKLRRLRVKKSLSQSELANLSGVQLKTLQRLEQNEGRTDSTKFNILCELCFALDCKLEDIIEDENLLQKYKVIK